MCQFFCAQCQQPIFVRDGQIDDRIVCQNCNTRQPVPASAAVIDSGASAAIPDTNFPTVEQAGKAAGHSLRVIFQNYLLMLLAGYVLIIAGIVSIPVQLARWYETINDFSHPSLVDPLCMIATGIVIAGLGQALLSLRDIALKHRKPK